MTNYKTTYWDSATNQQRERDCTQSEIDEIEARIARGAVRIVPTSVSPRQIRQALTRTGLRDAVEATVAVGDQDLKDWWEFSTVFERSNQHVINTGTVLNVTELQLDDLWTLAGSL